MNGIMIAQKIYGGKMDTEVKQRMNFIHTTELKGNISANGTRLCSRAVKRKLINTNKTLNYEYN